MSLVSSPMITLMVTLTGKSRSNHAKTLSRDDQVDGGVHDEMMMAKWNVREKKEMGLGFRF